MEQLSRRERKRGCAQVALPCCMLFDVSVRIVLVKIYFRKSLIMNYFKN